MKPKKSKWDFNGADVLDLVKPTHLAFVRMRRSGLESWQKMKANEFSEFREVPTTYVGFDALLEKARCSEIYYKSDLFGPSVWEGTPGFMCRSWVNKYRGKAEFNYKFGTGIYCSSTELLLVDDIFAWIHSGLPIDKVRSAFDIICELQKKIKQNESPI